MSTTERKQIYFLDINDLTALDCLSTPLFGLDLGSIPLGAVDIIDRTDIFEGLVPPRLDGILESVLLRLT
jgi:hypothetical protein